LRVIKAAKARRTNANGEAKLAPELVLGGALAVLDPLGPVDVAVLEADPLEVPVLVEEALEEVTVEFPKVVADEDAEDPVEVAEPELEEDGPPVISNRTL
jgi:hypothetical protein